MSFTSNRPLLFTLQIHSAVYSKKELSSPLIAIPLRHSTKNAAVSAELLSCFLRRAKGTYPAAYLTTFSSSFDMEDALVAIVRPEAHWTFMMPEYNSWLTYCCTRGSSSQFSVSKKLFQMSQSVFG